MLNILTLIFLYCTSIPSQTAYEIIKKSEILLKGESSKGKFKMTVVKPEYSRTMEMESYWVGNEKALITIKSPKREAGNKTLKIKNELWMYLRNTETIIKIPPSMLLQSWNGSDFTNDDLVRESNLIEDYNMKILDDEIIDNEICWKIELLPKPDAPVVWGRIIYWCRKRDYLPAKIDYYDEKNKLVRTMVYSDYRMFKNRYLPAKWIMYNRIKEGQRTEFEIIDIDFDAKFDDKIFSLKELERIK